MGSPIEPIIAETVNFSGESKVTVDKILDGFAKSLDNKGTWHRLYTLRHLNIISEQEFQQLMGRFTSNA